jgi:hypothetical protein
MTNKLRTEINERDLQPGQVIVLDVSYSTLRRWEKRGWIRDVSASGRRFGWIVLTTHGYMRA